MLLMLSPFKSGNLHHNPFHNTKHVSKVTLPHGFFHSLSSHARWLLIARHPPQRHLHSLSRAIESTWHRFLHTGSLWCPYQDSLHSPGANPQRKARLPHSLVRRLNRRMCDCRATLQPSQQHAWRARFDQATRRRPRQPLCRRQRIG